MSLYFCTMKKQDKMSQDTLKTKDMIRLYHTPDYPAIKCGSSLTQTIDAPLPLVWSVVRQFANPKAYKQFVKSCCMVAGEGSTVGSIREVTVLSGLPAHCSHERLDLLDDELHMMVYSIIGGNHRLMNYQSTMTLHNNPSVAGPNGNGTTVIESYVVDVPQDSNKEDTRSFVETIIGCNLRSLAKVLAKMVCALKA